MAGYIGLKPHMDVIVHHTTVSGEFALCRSQWRITGTDKDGNPLKSITTGWRLCAASQAEGGSSSSITPGSGPFVGSGPASRYDVKRAVRQAVQARNTVGRTDPPRTRLPS